MALVAIVPPHFLAGALGWSVPVIAALTSVALFGVVAIGRMPTHVRLDVVLVAVWGFTLLQLVPIPAAWLGWLSPSRLEVLSTRSLAGVDEGFVPFSLDPGRTLEQVVVGLGVLAAYAVGRVHAAAHGRRGVIVAVATSCVVVVVVGFGHELVGAEAVYGWHRPVETSPQLLSPLLNTNHFGGFAAFGAALCLGLAAKRRRAVDLRWAWTLGSIVCGAAAIVAASRGAVLSLALGVGAAGAALVRRPKGSSRRRELWAVALLGAAGIVALAAYLGLERTFRDFEQGDFSKLDIARASLPLVAEMPWIGVGRGAYAPVFVSLDPDGSAWTTTPENLVVLWVVEWGIPMSLLLLAALVAAVWRAWRSEHREVAAAAGALAALAIHDLVDFSLEMPGIVVVAALLLGAIVTPRREKAAPADKPARVWMGVSAVAALVALALAPLLIEQRPEALRESVLAAAIVSDLDALAMDVAHRHPLDPSLALFVAHGYERLGSREALPWVNRSMQLAPGWASPHAAAARLLVRLRAYRQALLEVREAENRQPGSASEVACAIASEVEDATLLELAPEDSEAYLVRLSRCLPAERLASVDAAYLTSGRDAVTVRVRSARQALRAGDVQAAQDHADRARASSTDPSTAVVLAEVLAVSEGPSAALNLLREVPASAELLRTRARLAAEAGDEALLAADLSRLRVLAAGRPAALAAEWAFLARLEDSRGNHGAALIAAERAHQLQPRDDAHLGLVARMARSSGQLRRAHAANTELCRRGVASACQALERTSLSRQRSQPGGATAGETP